MIDGRCPALVWIGCLSECLETIILIRADGWIVSKVRSTGLRGECPQAMIGAEFADPVLAVQAGNLAHGNRVVVEAEPVRGKTIQALIDNAGTGVQLQSCC